MEMCKDSVRHIKDILVTDGGDGILRFLERMREDGSQ